MLYCINKTSVNLRCAEFPECPGDQVWDGAQCTDLECGPRETPSYSLTGDDNIMRDVMICYCWSQVSPSVCARLAGPERLGVSVARLAPGPGVHRERYYRCDYRYCYG